MDRKLHCNGLDGSEENGKCGCERKEVVHHHMAEVEEEEPRQSREWNGTSSGRFTTLLRSSLRLSAPAKKKLKSTSPNAPTTASVSPRLASHGTGSPQRIETTASISNCDFPFCRICHESTNDVALDSCGRLIAPCLCDGSLKYVHEKCVQRWIEISQLRRCELCHFEYETRRYTKPIREWKFFLMDCRDLRKLFCFITIYLLIQACVSWALYALISNLSSTGISSSERNWQFWLKVFVVFVGMFSVGVFAYVQTRYCCDICQRWRQLNRVCVVREPPKERIAKMRREQRLPSNQFCIVHEVDTFTAMP
uniref:RING-CH-type domain-containing protein n=1 Tax=Echinococcus canadensis TaxID=519352 RepID=A0A915EZB6_9CEST